MTADQKVDLLRHVAVDVHGGLLVKRDRNGNPEGTTCGGYSCDVICFSDAVLFDVLADQDATAAPAWGPTSNPRGYRCELVAAGAPPISVPPAAPPPTVVLPPIDLSGVNAAIDRVLANLTEQITETRADVNATKADVAQLRQDVKTSVGDVLMFVGKYIAPASLALWAGMKVAK